LATLVLLVVLTLLFGQPPRAGAPGGSSDAEPHGVRAAFLLLQGLGYDVAASRRLSAGRVRWLLFPSTGLKELPALANWVRQGGTLLLADTGTESAKALGIEVAVESGPAEDLRLTVEGERLRVHDGGPRVLPRRPAGRTWPAEGEPLLDVYRNGQGEVWVLRRPAFLRNERIRGGDNGVVLCRLAEAMGAARGQRVYFDEYFHGLRDRPGPVELLLQPPALWVTLQGAALVALALWRSLPRTGSVSEPPAARRRSKDEYLDAMAGLLERKRAHAEGHRVARDALARELEHALGLPPGTAPERVALEAARQRPGLDQQRLARALAPGGPPRRGAAAFLRDVNELESLRDQFFHGRHHR
jgi:hypothetical protein